MTRLNHSRPILKLLSAKKRGLAISGLAKKHVSTASKATTASTKPRQAAGDDRELMHEVAVAILDHIDKCGDYTDANKLIEFARNGPERDAIREWFSRYSKIEFNGTSHKFSFIRTKLSDRTSAAANPFWTLKEPPRRLPFRFADQLARLVAKARQQQDAGDSTDNALLNDVEDVLHSHGIHLFKQTTL